MPDSVYSVSDATDSICVYIEHTADGLAGVSIELLQKARELGELVGWPVSALLLGDESVTPLADQAIWNGADEVISVFDSNLHTFSLETHTHVLDQIVREEKPNTLLVGATPNGRDLAGRLAVRWRTGLNADCTDLKLSKDGVLVSEVSGFGGGVLALLEAPVHRPQMSTVRPGVFPAHEPERDRSGVIRSPSKTPEIPSPRLRSLEHTQGKAIDLTSIEILICGGRGIDGDFAMLEKLASALGGAVGATRPPVDEGFIERERQIGQTGVICRPRVVINCGISGAFHYVVGIQEADLVISINTDPEAPIFEYSDYCVVGDVHEVVPALQSALEGILEGSHA
jgi:electron transfer flavoprotein alpha subunit